MFCKKCGNQMPDGSLFCASCGTPQDTNSASTPTYDTNSVFTGQAAPQPRYQYGTPSTGMSSSLGNSYSPLEKPKKSKAPLIIGIVAAVLCLAIIAIILVIVFSKSDEEKKNADIVDKGYVTEEQDYDKALKELIDTYVKAIYDYNYDVFKACMFPGDFADDRARLSTHSDNKYMEYFAPIPPDYDTFKEWNIEITSAEKTDDSTTLAQLNENYGFTGDLTIEVYYDIYFDMTMKSDVRTVTFPCNVELVYSNGHWYLWYTYFDAFSYDIDTYEFTGDGVDYFVRDYTYTE